MTSSTRMPNAPALPSQKVEDQSKIYGRTGIQLGRFRLVFWDHYDFNKTLIRKERGN